jgi:hypothetical protein
MLCAMTSPDVHSAAARSFLGGLPRGLVDRLLATGTCVDVPSGTTVYRPATIPERSSWCTACSAST